MTEEVFNLDSWTEGMVSDEPLARRHFATMWLELINFSYESGGSISLPHLSGLRDGVSVPMELRGGIVLAKEGENTNQLKLFVAEKVTKEGQIYHVTMDVRGRQELSKAVLPAMVGNTDGQVQRGNGQYGLSLGDLTKLQKGEKIQVSFSLGAIPFGQKFVAKEQAKNTPVKSGSKYPFLYPLKHEQVTGDYVPSNWQQVPSYPKDADGKPVPTRDSQYWRDFLSYPSLEARQQAEREFFTRSDEGEHTTPANGAIPAFVPAAYQNKPDEFKGAVSHLIKTMSGPALDSVLVPILAEKHNPATYEAMKKEIAEWAVGVPF